jgi:glycerol-3-phosphate O-acyltransferase/dihydroxyacetone phosphate acyltransferase
MRILRSVDRRISWLMAEKSFARPFIGSLASAIGALPVSRAMDIARPGRGAVFLPEPCTDPKFLRGIGTDFTASDFETGGSLYLPTINGESHKLDISQIYGPDAIILKTAPSSSDTFFQLTGKRDLTEETPPEFRGSEFKVAPRVDQTRVYSAVFERLQTGGCIGIFPEGGSHDRTSLLPLKGSPLVSHPLSRVSEILT